MKLCVLSVIFTWEMTAADGLLGTGGWSPIAQERHFGQQWDSILSTCKYTPLPPPESPVLTCLPETGPAAWEGDRDPLQHGF